MVTTDLHIELPPFFVNQSRWKSYQDCDRLYAWWEVMKLVPARKKAYFEIGTGIHAAQVHAHSKTASAEDFAEGTDLAVSMFEKGMRSGGPILPGDDEEIQQGVDTIKRMLPAYHQHYSQQGRLWKPLGMELSFKVEVGEGTGVWLVGRIDNLVTFMNSLWLVDYKTMAKLDMREFLKYEIDVQLTAYIYGGTKQLTIDSQAKGGPPVMIRGAIIDGLVKTKIPQFHREMYTRSVEDLREFELEFCQKAWEMAAKHAILNDQKDLYDIYCAKLWDLGRSAGWKTTFPKNTQQCFRYGTCGYRDLCVRDTEVRRMSYRVRDEDYVDVERKKSAGRGEAGILSGRDKSVQ